MTLVDADTGEIVPMISAEDARTLTDRIKFTVEGAWELIKQAYETQAHRALGYSSWDDYCTREFGTSRLRLPKEERQEVVASLRESGLSIRAIAAVTGDSHETVRRDLDAGVTNVTPAEDSSGSGESDADGSDAAAPGDDEQGHGSPDPSPAPNPRTTGLDGKSYPAKDRAAVRERRRRVRELHASGHMTSQIASELGISQEAVSIQLRAMGLKPVASTARSRHKRTDFDVIEKVVQQLAAVRLAVESTDLSNLADSPSCGDWLVEVEAAMKAIRGLRGAMKGASNGEA